MKSVIMDYDKIYFEKVQRLNEIGIALSYEHNPKILLEKILISAKLLTNADGGTIYCINENKLNFEIVWTDSLNFRLGGSSKEPVSFSAIPLFLEDGKPNDKTIVAYSANNDITVNIKDAYTEQGFDFSGTRFFDKKNGYRTKSVLTVPIKSYDGIIIAVLQLINALDSKGNIISFSEEDQNLAESLASQAAVALSNLRLINDLKILLEGVIKLIADAIDEKSPITGKHCQRVPVIAEMFALAINETTLEPFETSSFSSEEIYELKIAALLHDCGKIVTPVHIIEKSRKLEAIFDRMILIDTRYEVLKRDLEIELLNKKLNLLFHEDPYLRVKFDKEFQQMDMKRDKEKQRIKVEQEFLSRCNENKEIVTQETIEKIRSISEKPWEFKRHFFPFLSADEVENLSITSGNLTDAEREIINYHIIMTIKMLTQLPYPRHLRNVPEIAGSHHERIDGSGYPYGRKGEDLSVRAKILAIADVFEALTSPERPYKQPLKLSEALKIIEEQVNAGKFDRDLFNVFVKEKVYLSYANDYLTPDQIDID